LFSRVGHFLFDLRNSRDIDRVRAHAAPLLDAVLIEKDSGAQCDVIQTIVTFMSSGVEQSVFADDLGTGIAQDRELFVSGLFPDGLVVGDIIYTDGDDGGLEGGELIFVLRELAQLLLAVGSPVSTVEDDEHALAVQGSEREVLAVLVFQGKERRGFAGCRSDLRLGRLDHGPYERAECDRHQQQDYANTLEDL